MIAFAPRRRKIKKELREMDLKILHYKLRARITRERGQKKLALLNEQLMNLWLARKAGRLAELEK